MTTTQTSMTVDAIFRARPAAATAQVMNQMERQARLVFMLLDGKRTVRDVARLLHHTDLKLTSVSQCAQKATFLLAQEARSQVAHNVSVPLNPALQLLDAVTLTDSAAPTGSGQNSICRIARVLARVEAQQGVYDIQLELEGL